MAHERNFLAVNQKTQPNTASALLTAEVQGSIAEIQARMIIARSSPRDPITCLENILNDCASPQLAQLALYQYARGGSDISGPSIRLAEAIARRWGNISTGIREVSRSEGRSECVAFAWDLETNFHDERKFQVRHWRDTKKSDKNPAGGYALSDERDIYELIANVGQRRKRACLLTVLPGDIVLAAKEECETTLRTSADTSVDAVRRMVVAFREMGVSQAQIEKRIQRRLEAIQPAQVNQLSKIYASLVDGMSKPEDWFEPTIWTQPAAEAAVTSGPTTDKEPLPTQRFQAEEIIEKPQNSATKPPDSTTVEIWATDEFGEPATDGHGFTPLEFAKWFAAALFRAKTPAALIEHNADALKDAREADPAAEAEIVDAIMRHDKRRREDGPFSPSKPKGRTPVKGPTTSPGYQDRCRVEIDALPNETSIIEWIATNEPTYKNRATEIPINAAIERRRKTIAPDPSPDDIFPGDIPLATEGPSE